jgi:hypothetical protein
LWEEKMREVTNRELIERLIRERDELKARVNVLEDALRWIEDAHTPDQPATSPLTEIEWTLAHVGTLRYRARTALQEQSK